MASDKTTNTRFNRAPTIYKSRTKFDLSHSILDDFDTGELVPILCEPVYPGDTFSLRTASLIRLETSLHQTMDNAFLEFAYFFVPSKTVWKGFEEYQGYNKDAWARLTEKTKPQINLCGALGVAQSVATCSILNHLMLPSSFNFPVDTTDPNNKKSLSVDQLPLRCVASIYNNYFRRQAVESEVFFPTDDSDMNLDSSWLLNGEYFIPARDNFKVNAFPDMFVSALPGPQRGNGVSINLGGLVPVVTGIANHSRSGYSMRWVKAEGPSGVLDSEYPYSLNTYGDGSATAGELKDSSLSEPVNIVPANLYADLTQAGSVTINELRIAIAMQAKEERDARSGNRLKEKLWAVWHVDAPSLELDIPEFLGGKRIPISMMEVLQTSETGTTVLGTDAGHSKTLDADDSFIKSFTQWGYIIGLCWVRTTRSYSQGIDRKFFVKNLLDEYDPLFDNIGEMDVYKRELNCDVSYAKANETFGFQEAWYWLKERNNRFAGHFQPGITGTLSSWHYGMNFSGAPSLSASFIKQGKSEVERTLAVQQDAKQWTINVHFDMSATREMNKYSIPNTFGF